MSHKLPQAPHRSVIHGSRATEQGISLVELMVAIAVGLIVILIATTIYIEGLRNFSFRTSQSENLGNSRYTLATLDNEFTKAGYRRDPTQSMDEAFPADAAAHPNGCQFARGEAIKLDGSDLCIRYQPRDNNERDCAGSTAGIAGLKPYEAPPAPALGAGLFVERFKVTNAAQLVCQAGSQATGGEPVAAGVRGVFFEFGVGKGSDSFAERRVEAFKTGALAADDVIRSLRYSVLLASTAEKVTGDIESSVCTRWKESAGTADTRCDTSKGQLYQLASGSLTLRNLMP